MHKTCEEHLSGGYDMPCAWVDCANGVRADSFERKTAAGPVTLARVRVDAYDSTARYFWKAPDAAWWTIMHDLHTRELAVLLKRLAITGRAYHYTSVASFKEIVVTQELRLSDYRYLNDSSEIQHGLALTAELATPPSSLPSRSNTLIGELLKTPPEHQPRICVACFSLERDSLTQWKEYGENALGICFGVDPTVFASSSGTLGTSRFAPVLYADGDKRHLLQSLLHNWNELLDRDLREGKGERKAYEYLCRLYFYELLAMLKHSSFKDEREFRMIYQEHAQLFTAMKIALAPKRYRVAGALLVAYTTTRDLATLPHAQPKLGSRIAITDVVVGPHPLNELAVVGIRDFLASHGYDDVSVEPSRVPYR
jgi:Protein of unknown function (DUF2971)